MNELYGLADEAEAARPGVPRNAADPGAELRIDAETLAGFLADLYASRFDAGREVHAALYAEVRRILRRGVDTGLARADYRPDAAFANALRQSIDKFAAFKVSRTQYDMMQMLVDEDGRRRTFEEWRELATPIAGHQCGRWLRTEYDTAVLRAQQAADWQRFEAERDVLPNLEWMPSTSATPGADHQVFWHTIRPVDDPFWQQHRPGDRWNCKCSLEATDAPATDLPRAAGEALSQPQPGLDNNPGRDGQVFSDSHPYIAHAAPGAEEAVERITTRGSASKIAKLRAAFLKGETLTHPDFSHEIKISMGGIKEWTNQPHRHFDEKNDLLLEIRTQFPQTTYLGAVREYEKNPRVKASHIFEVMLAGEPSWIIVREYDNEEFQLHSISDRLNTKNLIK